MVEWRYLCGGGGQEWLSRSHRAGVAGCLCGRERRVRGCYKWNSYIADMFEGVVEVTNVITPPPLGC